MSSEIHCEAENLASTERRRLNLDDDPIIDARALIERQDVLVYMTPVPNGSLAGCFALINDEAWVMINSTHSTGRQRFTTAHEYCHSLAHRNLGFVICTDDEKPPHERFADAFAAAFLMPRGGVCSFFTAGTDSSITPEQIVDFCYTYGVSYHAAVYRLHNLKIFRAKKRDELLQYSPAKIAAAMGYDLQDPSGPFFLPNPKACFLLDSLPRAFRSLAIKAYNSERISESKLAELLRVDIDDLDDILEPNETE